VLADPFVVRCLVAAEGAQMRSSIKRESARVGWCPRPPRAPPL